MKLYRKNKAEFYELSFAFSYFTISLILAFLADNPLK